MLCKDYSFANIKWSCLVFMLIEVVICCLLIVTFYCRLQFLGYLLSIIFLMSCHTSMMNCLFLFGYYDVCFNVLAVLCLGLGLSLGTGGLGLALTVGNSLENISGK